jgi:hypothetical protein
MKNLVFILFGIFLIVPLLAEKPLPAEAVEPAMPAGSEYLIICGGPALRTWEKNKRYQHDNTWLNFISAAEIRWKQIKGKAQPGDVLTWLVFEPGYERRGKENGEDLVKSIENRARALGVNLKWFKLSSEVVDHINEGYSRDSVKIANLDYFGHSNRNCWMFDYSNGVDGCSSAFLHNKDLPALKKGSFLEQAHVQSWGCHSAQSFTDEWKRCTGTTMIGTVGKTDYSTGGLPVVTRARGWSS